MDKVCFISLDITCNISMNLQEFIKLGNQKCIKFYQHCRNKDRKHEYHEPRSVETEKGDKFIQSSKQNWMQVTPYTLFPFPRQMAISTNFKQQSENKQKIEIKKLTHSLAYPNAMRWATSRACQCSSGLKYVCTSSELIIRVTRQRIKILGRDGEEFIGFLEVDFLALSSSAGDMITGFFLRFIFSSGD